MHWIFGSAFLGACASAGIRIKTPTIKIILKVIADLINIAQFTPAIITSLIISLQLSHKRSLLRC